MIDKYLEIYNYKNNICLIGPCIPPIGGVSIHMDRLYAGLKKRNCQVSKFCTNKKNKEKLIFYLLKKKDSVLHFHNISPKSLFWAILFKKLLNFRIIVTDHNPRFFKTSVKKNIFIYKIVLPFIDHIIFVNDHIHKEYEKNKAIPKTYSVLNSFLPPPEEDENKIIKSYSKDLLRFINNRSPLLIANAFQIVFFENKDLYGLDMCVDLIKRLKSEFTNIGLIFALANETANPDYLHKIKNRIKQFGIEDNFYFLTGQKQLWPLFKKANLMVRPTLTDGDAISIREAQYFNCQIVASDAINRPEKSILFKNRDFEDFFITTLQAIKNVLKE